MFKYVKPPISHLVLRDFIAGKKNKQQVVASVYMSIEAEYSKELQDRSV